MERIIGRHSGLEKGPLLIVFGGMHGNEKAGVKALDLMFKMLEVEPITNPAFTFKGRILGIRANIDALQKNVRFIDKDLNRCWIKEEIDRIMAKNYVPSTSEERQLYEIMHIVKQEIRDYEPDRLYTLDLHTTSSEGGIFTIIPHCEESAKIGLKLVAPVITGVTDGVVGTCMQYFNSKNMGVPTVSLTFESGQHDDDLSINRAIAALTNYLSIIGCIDERHIENRHNLLLKEYSRNLPKLSKLIMKYSISKDDEFVMNPGYYNFKAVRKNEELARDKKGVIKSPNDGLILMPLYQNLGSEGFFIIEEIKGISN